jgi:hypothetical protein
VVVVGAKRFFFGLSDRGGLLWKSGVKTTVYSIHAADINKDGEGDVVVGSTRYVNVYDGSTGSLAGAWTYKEEIQGLTTVFEVKDANARSIQAADLDGDGDVELVVGFGWEEDQLDKTFHFGDIRVLEVNKSYNLFATKPTVKPEPQVQDVVETTTTTTIRTATTLGEYGPYTPTETKPVDSGVDDEGGGLCCLPLLPAVLALAFSLMAGTAVKLS